MLSIDALKEIKRIAQENQARGNPPAERSQRSGRDATDDAFVEIVRLCQDALLAETGCPE